MNEDKIINEFVKKAQEIARKEGLKIGGTVAHPSDPIIYDLFSIKGKIATVRLPANKSKDGKEVKKQFPLNELFDPNVAMKLADDAFAI